MNLRTKISVVAFAAACVATACASGRGAASSDARDGESDATGDIGALSDVTFPYGDGGRDIPGDDAVTDVSLDGEDDATADSDSDSSDARWDVDPAGFAGQPDILDVFPALVPPGSAVYVTGARLARALGDSRAVEVRIVPRGDGEPIPLTVLAATPSRLVLRAPDDLTERLVVAGDLRVGHPGGSATWGPVWAVTSTPFGGLAEPERGLLGDVFRLVEGTERLPNLYDPCSDPVVLNSAETPCPFLTLLTPTIDVPEQGWAGFPTPAGPVKEWLAMRYSGYLRLEESGMWEFELCSQDGSSLDIELSSEWRRIVSNDGLHAWSCVTGPLRVDAGTYEVNVDYFLGTRTEVGLVLRWKPPGETGFATVPSTAFVLTP